MRVRHKGGRERQRHGVGVLSVVIVTIVMISIMRESRVMEGRVGEIC